MTKFAAFTYVKIFPLESLHALKDVVCTRLNKHVKTRGPQLACLDMPSPSSGIRVGCLIGLLAANVITNPPTCMCHHQDIKSILPNQSKAMVNSILSFRIANYAVRGTLPSVYHKQS